MVKVKLFAMIFINFQIHFLFFINLLEVYSYTPTLIIHFSNFTESLEDIENI